jgi:hypothetical protein
MGTKVYSETDMRELIESSEDLDLQRREQLLSLATRAAAASKEMLAISELAARYASMVAVTESEH